MTKMSRGVVINKFYTSILLIIFVLVILLILYFVRLKQTESQNANITLTAENVKLNKEVQSMNATISSISASIEALKNEDLRKTNANVKAEITKLENNYRLAVTAYEGMLYLKDSGIKIDLQETQFSAVQAALSKDDLTLALNNLNDLNASIKKEKDKLLAAAAIKSVVVIPANVPAINQAPSSGYRRQKVDMGGNSYLVDIISADLNSTKVIVDTASDGTCTNNCPVMSLAAYAGRSGAYAGINGTYFCPDTYPSCSEKKNSFDVLVMNKNKVYFNSDNNVYSTVPVAIFSGNSARFIGQSSGWGRDTGVDAVIANRPLLVLDGNLMFGSGGEEKEVIRGNRSFLGASGNIAYIGIVYGASVVEAAKVLQVMGIKSAINLDSGGSSALWNGGYKAGPGRNLPNVVLFVKK